MSQINVKKLSIKKIILALGVFCQITIIKSLVSDNSYLVHTCMHTCIHTYTHIHIHIHIHMHIHIHIHIISHVIGSDVFTTSTDGFVLWWDTRKLVEPVEKLPLEFAGYKPGVTLGGIVLEYGIHYGMMLFIFV